jgi:hypothetical protein
MGGWHEDRPALTCASLVVDREDMEKCPHFAILFFEQQIVYNMYYFAMLSTHYLAR